MQSHSSVSLSGVAVCAAIVLAVTGAVIAVVQSDYRASSGPELGKEFTYDLSALRNIEPSLIDYVEGAPIQTGFQVVHAIATGPSDRIYVGGDSGVRVFGVDGKRALEFKLDAAAACLVVSSDGTIYVGINDHVELFDAKGARKARWSAAAAKSQLTSIAVSKSGVFVADWNERIVLHYDTKGTLLARIGAKSQSTKAPGFIVPSPYFDVAVSPKGMLLVADTGRHQLESYSADGQFKSAWGKFTPEVEGFCGCCNPAHFALLPDGRFVTTEKGLLRVKTYAVDGTFQSVVAPPAVFPDQPLECQDDCHKGIALPVAADSRGRVLVLDPVAKNVRVFVMKAKEVNDDPF